jgi:hypothetical protein
MGSAATPVRYCHETQPSDRARVCRRDPDTRDPHPRRRHAARGRGTVAFADADPERPIGFAFVMNRMQQNLAGDPRTVALIDGVKRSL